MRTIFITLTLFMIAVAAEAQPTVRCESSGRYRECDMAGIGRVELTRQLSKTECEQGETWGYRDGKVWVDKGCRAEFALVERGFGNRRGGRLITCESDGGRNRCNADTRGGVSVSRQLSKTSCVQGRSWGYDGNAIWVDQGCRAEFLVGGGRRDRGRNNEQLDELVVCESDGGRRTCAANTAFGVQLIRQISQKSCSFGRDWGYDRNGIWVTNGCRAEFAITTRDPRGDSYGGGGGSRGEIIACEASSNGRKYCTADTSNGVELSRQISDADCVFNRTWGYDNRGVWVSNGCRAEFTLLRPRR